MKRAEAVTSQYLVKEYQQYEFMKRMPVWMKKCHWSPHFLLRTKDKKRILAVDLILSGVIPQYQYSKIVRRLLDEHKELRVIIVALEEKYEENPEIEEFCKAYEIGLKIIIPGVGLQTILRTDFDSSPETVELPLEDGWFPSAILQNAKRLRRLDFSGVIDDFIDKVQLLGNDEQKTLRLVHGTIDKLLQYHPSFTKQFGQFMKLSHFEKLLRLSNPESSEHVLHSFRVFLAGCSVINQFYDKFKEAQRPFCKMNAQKLRVEYAWLLTAIFHDIGRPKEGMVQFVSEQFDDEDLEISIKTNEKRWVREHNITARRVLGSLGVFIVNESEGEEWDGGIIDDEDSSSLTTDWIKMYDEMKSHAVIGAFDFLGDLFKKAAAAGMRKHRPFIITHAAPAALSILLHHWKIWPEMRKMKLIPVNVHMLPMAALLIYIDTWDNYKRKSADPSTYIKEYRVDSKGVCVKIEWGNRDLMKKDEVGYLAYKEALDNLLFALDIEYGMVGDL